MDAYTGFAYVYDEYMDNIPYEEWGQYMIALLKENGVSGDSSVLELGCGTGTVTRMLAKEGYDCVGLDMSEDMLSIASEKTFEEGPQIIYTCQDMRDFEVPYEVDAYDKYRRFNELYYNCLILKVYLNVYRTLKKAEYLYLI